MLTSRSTAANSRVSGTIFEITDAELAAADQYEKIAVYKPVVAILASGKQAWVYVDTRFAPVECRREPGARHGRIQLHVDREL